MPDKKLFLLDAYALIYRAYYALIRAPRITSKGLNTSAIFGFCNTLDDIIRKENPTHIAVCFDPSGPTFRHEMYAEYKAQRDKQPEDITLAVPYIKRILEAMRIPVVEQQGYEADDVIGTLSRMAEREGFTTYMMTPDKDYGQLVTDKVFMYRPALKGEGFEVRGPEQVCARYGIERPEQVIDLLALEGDASDNIPGCPGVGEKTAVKLIAEFGSVENMIAHTHQLKGALRKKIEENTDKIIFSKELVTICTHVPLPADITPESLIRKPENTTELINIYRELEFRSFIKKLTDAAAPAPAPLQGSLFDMPEAAPTATAAAPIFKSFGTVAHTYTRLSSLAQIAEAVEQASKAEAIGLCIATEGASESMNATICGLAIATHSGNAWHIDIPTSTDERREMAATLQPLFTQGAPLLVSDDCKRAILLLRRIGLHIECGYFDISVAHYLIEPEKKHAMRLLAAQYLDYDMLPDPASRARKACAPTPDAACETADIALQLLNPLRAIIDRESLHELLTGIELPLIRVLADMEWAGVRIDVAELHALSTRFTERLTAMEQEAYTLAGTKFNVSSPMQVGDILFERMKIDPKAKKTKTGAYSTTEDILEKFRHDVPLVDLILKIRALKKLLTTYVNALPELVNPHTGKIHTSFNQTVTATGRISSTNPNLQNIPVRSDDGREIRRAFIPDPGNILLAADYSQIELRLMADLSADPSMIEAFHSGADFHRATAAKIYHEELDQVSDSQRRNAKTANFGIIYGISAFGLSERLGISRGEAKDLIDGYFKSYPGVKQYMEQSIETARTQGYVTTVMGRRRMLADINSRNAVVRGYAERNAINAPLQGSAADIIKLAMVRIARHLDEANLKSKMILQVHDELVFDVVPEELTRLKEIVATDMEQAFSGSVALEVSVGTGHNWLQAH